MCMLRGKVHVCYGCGGNGPRPHPRAAPACTCCPPSPCPCPQMWYFLVIIPIDFLRACLKTWLSVLGSFIAIEHFFDAEDRASDTVLSMVD